MGKLGYISEFSKQKSNRNNQQSLNFKTDADQCYQPITDWSQVADGAALHQMDDGHQYPSPISFL